MITLYLDPGTGSMLISAVIALFSVGFFMLKGFIYRKLNIGGSKGASIDPANEYGLVFYSEGKQYWNVFRPILEELSERSIPATFFSSDENDPALSANIKGIDTYFIGTGREAYFILNRLNADMVVMTTPGLDVLEVKRSKNVKHYSHITHAPGCVAGYKSYAVDYFDSVLLGGDADIEVIRELEAKRNLPKKEVVTVGHTYLDVYRERLSTNKYDYTYFKERRPTILISPTWGNHGLLTKYGETILSKLDNSDLYNVIIRPHPQSLLTETEMLDKLIEAYPSNEHRIWDKELEGLKAMSHADIMISDFSGIIFDFLTLFEKPILTMHGNYEKRGRDAIDLEEDPWDIQMIGKIGRKINKEDVEILPDIISDVLNEDKLMRDNIAEAKYAMDKYPGESRVRASDFIGSKLKEIQALEEVKVTSSHKDLTLQSAEVSLSLNKKLSFLQWSKSALKLLINPNTLFQIFMTLMLFGTYIFIGRRFLPTEGLNQVFLIKLLPYAAIVTMLSFLIFIGMTWIKGKGSFYLSKNYEAIKAQELLLTALPMTPILQYIIANQDILTAMDSFLVFVIFFIISTVFIVFIPFVLSTLVSKSLTIPMSLGFLFVVFNMADFGQETRALYIVITLLAISVIAFVLLFSKKQKLLVVVVSIFFLANVGGFIFSDHENSISSQVNDNSNESIIAQFTKDLLPKRTPDVFLLIYESYSNQETMKSYGFDNTEQTNYLLDQGFAIYDGTYTVGANSLLSMAHVLNPDFDYLEGRDNRDALAGNASGVEFFDKLGYNTNFVLSNDYMTKGYTSTFDYAFPDEAYSIAPYKIIIEAVLEGEFRFDADFSTVEYVDYLESKENVLLKNFKEPAFLYTHNNYPGHSQNSGILRPDESERHFNGIVKANEEMRNDIEALDLNNRDTIVIIAGDHGPYLTKNGIGLSSYELDEINRLDIQDRYGNFLAISWPDSEYADRYDIKILQDVLPAVIAYMHDDDSLFDKTRLKRETLLPRVVGGAVVVDGIIVGGEDDGKPLFENTGVRIKN